MKITHTLARATALVLVVVLGTALLGCSEPAGTAQTTQSLGDPDAQTCGVCGGKGDAKPVVGVASDIDGVQTCAIGVENGYLTPNTFTLEAGKPVALTFEGSAQGCLAMPKVGTGTLNQAADFRDGEATLELGDLEPGTYPITCGMDQPMGSLVVR